MDFPKREGAGAGSADFLKIKDGDSIVGILRGERYSFFVKGGFGSPQQLVGPNEGGRERFRINFITKENDQLVSKIWEFGPKIYDQLSELSNEWDLNTTYLKISRTGSTKENTAYLVTPMKAAPNASALKQIEAVELKILNHNTQVEQKPKNYAPSADDNESIPF